MPERGQSPSPLAGEGLGCGVGARLRAVRINGIQYARHDAVAVGENVVVPEAQDMETLRGQISITFAVIGIFTMLAAIGFDDQPMFETNEVGDVEVVDNLLTSPSEALETSGTEDRP